MIVLYAIFIFLLGLGVGSFLNVVVLRLHSGESLVFSRSRCLSCGLKLQWRHLLPVASFLVQRGRCAYCGSRISRQYPLVEFSTGIVFLLAAWRLGIPADLRFASLLAYCLPFIFFGTLVAIAAYDIHHKIIPDVFVVILAAVALIASFLKGGMVGDIAAGVGAFLFFAFLWAISRGRWMGLGDAKLAFGLGVFLGAPLAALAVMFAFWIGALWGIVFVLLGTYTRKSQIPFGPFLAIAELIAFLFGSGLLSWYNAFIGL